MKFNKNRPYIPTTNKITGEEVRIQLCCFVFSEPLSEEQYNQVALDPDVAIHKVSRGHFVAHYLDDADWGKRYGIEIETVLKPMAHEYPPEINPQITMH